MRCPQGHRRIMRFAEDVKKERMFLPKAPIGNYTFKCLTHLLSKVAVQSTGAKLSQQCLNTVQVK